MINQIKDKCDVLEKLILEKFNLNITVLYGEVDNLREWFYLSRTLYNRKYRLGMTFESAEDYIKRILKDVPSDIIFK